MDGPTITCLLLMIATVKQEVPRDKRLLLSLRIVSKLLLPNNSQTFKHTSISTDGETFVTISHGLILNLLSLPLIQLLMKKKDSKYAKPSKKTKPKNTISLNKVITSRWYPLMSLEKIWKIKSIFGLPKLQALQTTQILLSLTRNQKDQRALKAQLDLRIQNT
jgi:hypothetical protein